MTLSRPILAAALAALSLSACGRSDDAGNTASANASTNAAAGPAARPTATLAAVIEGHDDLDTVHDLASNAGLGDVLGGVGPHTLFAPADAAFEALGDERVDGLKSAAMRPQAMALLRAHIVPGLVTRRDLDAALANAGGRPVQMRTMGGRTLTFARDGGAIVATSDDGARARLVGDESVATNGAVHPVDALLLRTEAAER